VNETDNEEADVDHSDEDDKMSEITPETRLVEENALALSDRGLSDFLWTRSWKKRKVG
jgi:hypothetical protein